MVSYSPQVLSSMLQTLIRRNKLIPVYVKINDVYECNSKIKVNPPEERSNVVRRNENSVDEI